jgi:hypothetical protein
MKRIGLIFASFIFLSFLTCSEVSADIIACDQQGCISEDKLLNNIVSTLNNNVVGYVVIVGCLPPAVGGQARTSSDPPATAMSPDLPMNIASVSKTLTAVAVLQLLAKDGLTIDTNISPYIYSDWTQGPNVNQLTFKELLTHTSGFGQNNSACTAAGVPYSCCTGPGTGNPGCSCGNEITYPTLKSLVGSGVQSSNIGVPQYGNCNFALLRELLPALSGQSITNLPDIQRAQASSNIY